jgi:hypothetical protein
MLKKTELREAAMDWIRQLPILLCYTEFADAKFRESPVPAGDAYFIAHLTTRK